MTRTISPIVGWLLLLLILPCSAKKYIEESNPIDVYYINLERRPDRRANIHREFEAAGMVPPLFRIHRFEAIDGLSHEFTAEEKSWFRVFDEEVGKTSPHNTNLLKANSLSHMGVWKKLVESGQPYALVFQDDVQLASQKGSDVFLQDLEHIFQQNPNDALITWIGANGYASGSVSRSAPMDPNHYNADTASTVLPGTQGMIGKCRKGFTATNSLAYILTLQGAQELLKHFTTKGWAHHTDHDLVDYLDAKDASYISRKILATTMDDGVFGSDIFSWSKEEDKALQKCQRLVRQGITASSLQYSSQRAQAASKRFGMLQMLTPEAEWAQSVKIHCEPMSCHFQDCPAPVVTYVYLSWPTSTAECETKADGTTTCKDKDDDKFELDASGVRRDKTRHKLMLGEAPENLTFQHVLDQLPARWVLEEWSQGKEHPMSPWPKWNKGEAVEALIEGKWLPARIAAVGYKEANWPVYATYVVQLDADHRLMPIVQEQQVRKKE